MLIRLCLIDSAIFPDLLKLGFILMFEFGACIGITALIEQENGAHRSLREWAWSQPGVLMVAAVNRPLSPQAIDGYS
ncbi:MAG: hypothetical protein QM605_12900 [Sphingobium sp.]